MPPVNPTMGRRDSDRVLRYIFLTTIFQLLVIGSAYVAFRLPLTYCLLLDGLFLCLLAALYSSPKPLQQLVRRLSLLARYRILSYSLVGISAFLLSAGLSLLVRMPEPNIHDEFSYLLASDTFAHGRLTNPTHPLWVHFETFHIIFQPTYASKYPPGQGLILAVGQVLTGYPIVGVWLSVALACALVCWMLMAWLPPRWALLGGFFAVVHPMMLYWSQNFWGGAVATAGGALLLGGFKRTFKTASMLNSILMGVGIAVLANSRPYEGLVLSVILLGALVIWVARAKGPTLKICLKRIALPLFAVLLMTSGAMAYYNLRVTGNILRMPYMVHESTYAVAPPLLFQHLRPEPAYNYPEFRAFYVDYVVPFYTSNFTIGGLITNALLKIIVLLYSCYWLLIPVGWLLNKTTILKRDAWIRFAFLIGGVFVVTLFLELWVFPHYAAPITGLVLMVSVQGLRYMRSRRFGGLNGKLLMNITLAFCVTALVIFCAYLTRLGTNQWNYKRMQMVSNLSSSPDRHLIIVRYTPEHNLHQEWVFNDADIDNSRVVWARDMGSERNKELLAYFKDCKVWLFQPDVSTDLISYPVN